MIARAAEGSARDGLSILDQAIAHGAGRGHRRTSPRHAGPCRPRPNSPALQLVLAGDAAAALAELDEATSSGSIRRSSFGG